MGERRSEGHITDPRNTRMGETNIRQRRMKASSEGGQGPEGAVAAQMEWNSGTLYPLSITRKRLANMIMI